MKIELLIDRAIDAVSEWASYHGDWTVWSSEMSNLDVLDFRTTVDIIANLTKGTVQKCSECGSIYDWWSCGDCDSTMEPVSEDDFREFLDDMYVSSSQLINAFPRHKDEILMGHFERWQDTYELKVLVKDAEEGLRRIDESLASGDRWEILLDLLNLCHLAHSNGRIVRDYDHEGIAGGFATLVEDMDVLNMDVLYDVAEFGLKGVVGEEEFNRWMEAENV